MEKKIVVSAQDGGKRLDVFLSEALQGAAEGFSRTRIQKSIQEGMIVITNMPGIKPHHRIKAGDEISIQIAEKEVGVHGQEDIPLEIVYDDADLAVINKQSGLVVHPAPGNYEHTLANALVARFKTLSTVNPERPGIVHRLDKDTSGLLVVAKNNFTHLELSKQFAKHSIKRMYCAIVKGKMEYDESVIELPIGRHPTKRQNMSVNFSDSSRYAKTFYRTLHRSNECSVLELEPFTGRTHQLRVHLAYYGHPILGDVTYGKNTVFPRMALHAKLLGFIHPRTGKYVEFTSDLPPEFKDFIAKHFTSR